MHLKIFVYLSCLLSFSQCIVPAKNTIKISPDNKNWAIEFRDAVNNHLQNSGTGDTLFIHFKEGTYQFNESFHFTGDSSVKTNAPIVIRGQEKTAFTGGIPLDNSALSIISNPAVRNRIISIEAREKVLEYDLFKDGINDLGEIKSIGFGRSRDVTPAQLYINGERMTLARYPNSGDPFLVKNRNTVIPIKRIMNAG